MLTIIVSLVILSILVLVHELGHFLVARKCRIGVEEFALGLPLSKPLWSKKLKSGLQVAVYPVLFGGFVRLLGEEGAEKSAKGTGIKGEYFYRARVANRIKVTIAGVVMNLILAFVAFYAFLALVGFKVLIPKIVEHNFFSPTQSRVVVVGVAKDTPAQKAGMVGGDVIVSVDNKEINKLSDFQAYIKSRAGQPVSLILSDISLSSSRQVSVIPRLSPPPGQAALGVEIDEGISMSFTNFSEKLFSGITYGVDMLLYNFKVIGHFGKLALKTGQTAPLTQNISGPVGIGSAVGLILDLGGSQAFIQLINLLGLLSLSLAFMNILPFPALDGGRFTFLLVEAVTSKKLPLKIENLVNQIGLGILLLFILLVSLSDLSKIFGR